ncbi:patatin-like phospholipase family protein [Variovorax paradoxus]|uniref:Patatin n=1 Tax=Variovorax paradoxus (strain EPS) TaxID=595537 RepID=E6V842_VARPE|nr:patatin-like phospholipase family protein [Variovorax paradoxus]ADU38394.1 Patatin [Variovorax paradoxus EPS]
MASPKSGYYTILSFVGGGIRGLLSATLLQRLFAADPQLLNQTKMYAGCSTGSIISSELLADPDPGNLITLFTGSELGFYNKMNIHPDKPAYPIDEVLGSQLSIQKDRKISEAGKDVLLVSFNVGSVEKEEGGIGKMMPVPWKPMMFTNMLGTAQDKKDGLEGNSNTLIAVAATSSGSMPGQLGSTDGNVDGCFFNHDPTVAAIALALRNGWELHQIAAITIGTGYMPYWLQSNTHEWGADQWINGEGNPFDNITPFLMNQKGSSPVLDMSLNGTSTDLMPQIAKMLLGDRYVNLNPTLPCFIPENSTNPQAIALLQDSANSFDISKALDLIKKCWSNATLEVPLRFPENTDASIAPVAAPTANAHIVPLETQFFIRQNTSRPQVLDIMDASHKAGARVILWEQKTKTDPDAGNQLWKFEKSGETGWWLLKSQIGADLYLTLTGNMTGSDPMITVEPLRAELRDRQLWNLVPTKELGYYYIQSKLVPSASASVNPNSYVPTVIGAATKDDRVAAAYGMPLDYKTYKNLSFAFIPFN